MSKKVLLIGFYNEKALGVKYLANALEKEGFKTHVVFFKEFNSIHPSKASKTEIDLLTQLIKEISPSYIGLSVMSSLYLETVLMVNEEVKKVCTIPIIWGGVYPTLFPDRAMEHADFVIRGEGEEALVDLLNTLEKQEAIFDISNLVYKNNEGKIVINDVRLLCSNLDQLGYPHVGGVNNYLIDNERLITGDPQENGFIYEMTASRGCPFACSYCSSINLKRIYANKGRYVRFRSVDSVINELKEAKEKMKKIKAVHFWDEIFSDDPEWIEEFKERYKAEVKLPFKIWGHPLKINKRIIEGLVEAGLYQTVVGIQSGSMRVRKEIFHRTETQEDIIEASKVLSNCGVPKIIYDFMLQHPFETIDDLQETFKLCLKLAMPFELQIHGLNFLPGTDIVEKAISEGYLTLEKLEKMMYGTIQEQYDMYWGPTDSNEMNESNMWVALIYLTQFPRLRPVVELLANEVNKGHKRKVVITLQKIMSHAKMFKSFTQKVKLVVRKK